METIVVGIIALLLFAYLLVAMIRPEKVAVHLHA
jgi:K+-transporting ATPase KdpF subunit